MPTDPPTPPGSRAWFRHGWEAVGIAVILTVAAWFYFWTATSAGSPLTKGLAPDDLYNRLADGFLAGRTSFAEEAPPELARLANPYDPAQNAPYKKYHDVTYYRGRYYLYFGPTPALVLLAPWKLLTGSSLSQNVAVVVFAWGVVAWSVLLALLAKVLKVPFFYFAMGSQSNIGGPASAPVVATVFHPSLAPVGALLGALGYATGTVAAYVVGVVLRGMAGQG